MKKLFIILLSVLPLLLQSQTNSGIMKFDGKIGKFHGEIGIANSFDNYLTLKLVASSISKDSLTFNSTGNLVTYASQDTVVLDDNSEVVIGNSIRFGTPTSGTIYKILDTLGSSDSLILDQVFTGSVTDEFYPGCVGIWHDESKNKFIVTQTTGLNQPKLLWGGTDSAEVCFDGVNDYMQILDYDIFNFGTGSFSASYGLRVFDDESKYFMSYGGASVTGVSWYKVTGNRRTIIIDQTPTTRNIALSTYSVTGNLYHYTDNFDRVNDTIYSYKSGSLASKNTIATLTKSINQDSFKFTLGAFGGFSAQLFAKCAFSDIYIYYRILTAEEISILSE